MIFCCLQATYDDSERTPHISDGNQSQHHFQIPGWGIRQHWWRKCSTACHHGNSEKGMGGQVVLLSLLPFTHHLPSLRVSPLSPSCLPPPTTPLFPLSSTPLLLTLSNPEKSFLSVERLANLTELWYSAVGGSGWWSYSKNTCKLDGECSKNHQTNADF